MNIGKPSNRGLKMPSDDPNVAEVTYKKCPKCGGRILDRTMCSTCYQAVRGCPMTERLRPGCFPRCDEECLHPKPKYVAPKKEEPLKYGVWNEGSTEDINKKP